MKREARSDEGTRARSDSLLRALVSTVSSCRRAGVPACLFSLPCLLLLCSCTGDKPETVQQRQDRLLADPFNTKLDQKPRDISGGTLGELNRDEMRKDLNSVFNP